MIMPAKEYWDTWTGGIYTPEQIMIEFAKIHVKAALEAQKLEVIKAWDKLPAGNYPPEVVADWLLKDMNPVITKLRTSDFYPLKNIK